MIFDSNCMEVATLELSTLTLATTTLATTDFFLNIKLSIK